MLIFGRYRVGFRTIRYAALRFLAAGAFASAAMPWGCGPRADSPVHPTAKPNGEPSEARAAPAKSAANSVSAEENPSAYLAANYEKREYRVPMRDGVHLFTQVFSPRDPSQPYPILLFRTPYSCNPYGETAFPDAIGPHMDYAREGYIFVKQDVRGCFMSEGVFVDMRPHIDGKKSPTDIDESSDTYDTIDWLLAHVQNHNGRVGMFGISYPGFYAAAGMIDAHPALYAVSPQAPIADWFYDDFHHHGAFFLPHAFSFMPSFCKLREGLTTEWKHGFEYPTPDGYQFFLNLGPLKNANDRYFHRELACWNDITEHPNYDEYWQSRNLLPHLRNVAPAVMTVGGWFDAEDLYGPLKIYRRAESENKNVFNILVMGPWQHGGWSRSDGDQLGNIYFDSKTAAFYRRNIEMPFFRHYLKNEGTPDLPEAYMFETGENKWHRFPAWPPEETEEKSLYVRSGRRLSWHAPEEVEPAFDEYTSDPAKPVPFTEEITTRMTRAYMTDDQRFAARRPDVLVYQTEPLEKGVTLAGPILADLWVSTSGTDSDWVVKLIDVFPEDAEDTPVAARTRPMSGYQMMVRSEVIRGRFRNGYETPEPFTPDEPTHIILELLDVLHRFREGHRIMVQIQSTWFPLVDRNPQTFVDNIYMANEADFSKAVQRVFRSSEQASCLRVGVLPDAGDEVDRETDASIDEGH